MRTIDRKHVPLFFQYKIWFNYSSNFMRLLLWFPNCGLNLKKSSTAKKINNETSACGNGNTSDHIMVAHSMCVMCLYCTASNLSFLAKLVNPLKCMKFEHTLMVWLMVDCFLLGVWHTECECSTIKWHGNRPHWTAINTTKFERTWRTAEKSIRSSRNSIFKWIHTKRSVPNWCIPLFKLRNKGHSCSLFCKILDCYALSKNIKSKSFISWRVSPARVSTSFHSCSSSSHFN